MGSVVLLVISFLLFGLCSSFLSRALNQRADVVTAQRFYSKPARSVGRVYQVFAWGLLSLVLLGWMVLSFWGVFVDL